MRALVLLLLQGCLVQASTFVIAAGVEKYDDPQVSALSFAVSDARSVAAAFRASGATPKDVIVLTSDVTDPARRPSRGNLLRAFGQVKQQAKSDDKLVFFFAGHGIERNGEQYLLGVDTQRDLLEDTALPMTLVNRALDGLACNEVLFLIDACRNDPAAGRGDVDANLTEEFARGLRPKINAPTTKPRFVATLLACDAGQRAWESPENKHGAFSLYLVKGLSGQAAGENGQVSLSRLSEYVNREVANWATQSKHEQRPRLLNPDGGDMVVLTAPPEPVVSVSFQNHTLAQVVELLAEQFSAQIVLGPGADPSLTVTGRLDNQPLGTVLKVLVAAHRLAVRREDKVYVIEGDGPQSDAPATPPLAQPEPGGQTDRRPENWPAYLANFQLPAGLSWADFRVRQKDGMPQVLIPGGPFMMGTDPFSAKRVVVSSYWMDLHEVTVLQFSQYCRSARASFPDWFKPAADHRDHPMVWVSWDEASAYAAWVGAALPTEAQWEKAARGGLEGKRFPWGDEDPVGRACFGTSDTMPVYAYPPNGFGLFDMAGNVWQWCRDYFDPGWYGRMGDLDPENTTPTDQRVDRGGGWRFPEPEYLEAGKRSSFGLDGRSAWVGFRCVQPADQP